MANNWLSPQKMRHILLALIVAGSTLPVWGQKIPLKVRMGDVSIHKVPFLVALDEGLYEKHGLAVDQIPFGQNAARVHGIEGFERFRRDNFQEDISIGGGAPMMVSRANRSEPSDRVVLATTHGVVRWQVVARDGINSLSDLKGKRIAYSSVGACSHYIALLLAKRMGWDPVQDLVLLGGNYSVNPLIKGWVDVLIAYKVPFAMARAAGYQSMADLSPWNAPIPCNGVNASRSWAQENRDTVLRFLRATTEAIALMKRDKYVAFKAMQKWYGFSDYEIQEIIYQGTAEIPRKPYPSVDGIRLTMELYDSAQMRRFSAEDFYDDSFLREVDESGFIDRLYP